MTLPLNKYQQSGHISSSWFCLFFFIAPLFLLFSLQCYQPKRGCWQIEESDSILPLIYILSCEEVDVYECPRSAIPQQKRAHVPSVPLIKTLNHSDLGVRPLKTPCLNNCFSSLPHFTPLPLRALRRLICLRVFISFTPISVHFCEDPGLLGPPGDHPLHTSRLPSDQGSPQETFSWPGEADWWDGRLALPRADPQLLLQAESERCSNISKVCLNLCLWPQWRFPAPQRFLQSLSNRNVWCLLPYSIQNKSPSKL